MRPPARVLFALLFALVAKPAAAAEPALDATTIDAAVESALKEFQAPGAAVVVVRDDKVVHLKGYGVRRLGGDASVTPDTVFPIASCTKPFTAALLAQLVGEGKLKVTARRITLRVGWARNAVGPPEPGIGGLDGS